MSKQVLVWMSGGMLSLALAACGPIPEGQDGFGETGAAAGAFADSEEGEGEGREAACQQPHKVEICHIPPGNPDNFHTLCVGEPAVDAHLAHGDVLGSCDDGDGDDDGTGDDGTGDDGTGDDGTGDDGTGDDTNGDDTGGDMPGDDTTGDDQGYRGRY